MRKIDILLLSVPMVLLTVVLGGLSWFVFGQPTETSATVELKKEILASANTLSKAQQCAAAVPETFREVSADREGAVVASLLGEPIELFHDGTTDTLSHERVHVFQLCTARGPVMSDEFYSSGIKFHSAVTAYALSGRGLSTLRMEHEAWTTVDNCESEWSTLYLEWRAGNVTDEDATEYLRSCIE